MTDYSLKFDGYKLSLIGDGAVVKSWDAISGNPGSQSPEFQRIELKGPIPQGTWTFNTTAIQTITVADDVIGTVSKKAYDATGFEQLRHGTWYGGTKSFGLERVELTPAAGTDRLDRTGLFIHGGDEYGSAGCIDLGHNEVDFFRTLTQNNILSISLNVQYDPRLYTDPHPLAGKALDSGPLSRGLFPTDHLGNPIALYNSPTSFLFPGAFAASASEFNNVVGHAFDGASPQDLALLINAVTDGRIQAGAAFVDPTSNDRFTGPFYTTAGDKIVVSSDSTSWFASMVRNGEVGRIVQNNNDGSRTDSEFDWQGVLKSLDQVSAAGDAVIKYFDTQNKHPYKQLEVTKDPDGEIRTAQAQLEDNIIAAGGSVGQIFGSALGRALAPHDQFAQIAVGTVAGLIGQKLLQTFTASLTLDASRFVAGNFGSVTGLDIAHAGIGAISSFLTAELGHAVGLTGLAGNVFNAGAGGVTASVLIQVVDKMALEHLSFDAAIGAISWGTAATQAGYNISSAAGTFLANAFVPAQSHEGAVGGQLFGAVGSALGLSAVLNATITGFMGFLIPGLGSLFGTIVGTMLGDAIAGDPVYPMAYHDVRILGSDYHFTNRLVGTDNHGNAAVSEEMGDQVAAIANSYLDAVHGAGIHFSGKVMIGYNAGAAPYQYITGWFPDGVNGPSAHFANATDAIQEGVRELLVNTEVIGGDLLMKRAHQAFISGPHPVPTEIAPDFTDLIKLSGDLSVAQDYQNYLNNREAINALIAAQLVRSRARRVAARPRAGSQARLQRDRMPRSFAAAANGKAVQPNVARRLAESEVPAVAIRTRNRKFSCVVSAASG